MSLSLLLTRASLLIPGLPSRESRYYVSSRGPTRRFKHHFLPAHRENADPVDVFLAWPGPSFQRPSSAGSACALGALAWSPAHALGTARWQPGAPHAAP